MVILGSEPPGGCEPPVLSTSPTQANTEPCIRGPGGKVWFTEPRATCALVELDTVFSGFSFQSKLRHLLSKDEQMAAQERRRLILGVLARILPTFGLEPDVESALALLDVIRTLCKSESSVARLEALLRPAFAACGDNSAKGCQAAAARPAATGEVEVRIRERSDGKEAREVYVAVPKTATLSEVLAAAALKLGDPTIQALGRFVKVGPNSTATAYRGDEPLGARRRLLLVVNSAAKSPARSPVGSPQTPKRTTRGALASPSPGTWGRIIVGLEYSAERLTIDMSPGDTVSDLCRRLKETVRLPKKYVVMARAKSGVLVHLQDTDLLPRKVILKGVASLSKDVHLIDEEFTEVLDAINQELLVPEFQQKVSCWKEALDSTELPTRLQEFRRAFQKILNPNAAAYGFENSEEGYKKWQQTMEEFQHFPAVAEAIRKYRILAGTLTPEKALQMRVKQIGGRVRDRNPLHYPRDNDRRAIYEMREIPCEYALVADRERALAAFDLMYRRIYEDNMEALWGDSDNMPTCEAVEWKYLEPAGSTLLHCSVARSPWKVLSAAVVHPIRIMLQSHHIKSAALPWKADSKAEEERNEFSSGEEDADEPPQLEMTVGYISGLAVKEGAQAGPVLIEHLLAMAKDEGWGMLVLHCIGVERSRRFFSRQGFSPYGSSKEMPFQLAMMQHCGVAVPKDVLEQQLPSRPQCLLHIKFIDRAT